MAPERMVEPERKLNQDLSSSQKNTKKTRRLTWYPMLGCIIQLPLQKSQSHSIIPYTTLSETAGQQSSFAINLHVAYTLSHIYICTVPFLTIKDLKEF